MSQDIKLEELISQETYKVLLNDIKNVKDQSSQEDPPISRRMNSAANNDLLLNIEENRSYHRKSLDIHKVLDKNCAKTLFLAKDKMVTVDVRYVRPVTGQLWIRLYPVTGSKEFDNMPVNSCKDHKVHLFNKHTSVNPFFVCNSIFELNDPDTIYENICLPSGEPQISARVRYLNPESSVHMAFKCYNTCIDVFKRKLPKMVFSIESYSDIKNEFAVLSETFLKFKVCASPSRDFRTAAHLPPRKKLCLKNEEIHHENIATNTIPNFSQSGYFVGQNKYYMKILHEKEVAAVELMRDLQNNGVCNIRNEAEDLEERILAGSSTTVSEGESGIFCPKTESLADFDD